MEFSQHNCISIKIIVLLQKMANYIGLILSQHRATVNIRLGIYIIILKSLKRGFNFQTNIGIIYKILSLKGYKCAIKIILLLNIKFPVS
jgi:hypothetical protein